MTIHRQSIETERGKFILQTSKVHNLVSSSHCLKSIFINDHNKIIQFPMLSKQHRLPHGTFVHLSIASNNVAVLICFAELRSESHAHAYRQAMAQRPGGHLATNYMSVRQSFQTGAVSKIIFQIVIR